MQHTSNLVGLRVNGRIVSPVSVRVVQLKYFQGGRHNQGYELGNSGRGRRRQNLDVKQGQVIGAALVFGAQVPQRHQT